MVPPHKVGGARLPTEDTRSTALKHLRQQYPSCGARHDPDCTWNPNFLYSWGIIKGDTAPSIINDTLQTALKATTAGAFPPAVQLLVSGHMHRFQSIGFSNARPPQLIIGTGGVALSKTYPKPDKQHPKDPFSLPVDGATGSGVGISAFGIMRIDLAAGGAWSSKLLDPTGGKLAECSSAWATAKPKQAVCVLK